MICLHNVSWQFEGKSVLQNLSLQLAPGERLALVGPSGQGKTTLLRILAGLLTPQMGTVSLPPQGASMIFQENRLIPGLSILENLQLVAPQTPVEPLVKLLSDLGLTDPALLPSQLSGGMARRVAIARAIAFDRSFFLMDEPFTGLDEETLRQTLAVVQAAIQGKTLLLVTHDLNHAHALGCKIISLEQLQPPNGIE